MAAMPRASGPDFRPRKRYTRTSASPITNRAAAVAKATMDSVFKKNHHTIKHRNQAMARQRPQ
jgi:hypothetical protein